MLFGEMSKECRTTVKLMELCIGSSSGSGRMMKSLVFDSQVCCLGVFSQGIAFEESYHHRRH